MLDLESAFNALRVAFAAVVCLAAAVLGLWLWKETRRPTSLFSAAEFEPRAVDRFTDRAASIVGAGVRVAGRSDLDGPARDHVAEGDSD